MHEYEPKPNYNWRSHLVGVSVESSEVVELVLCVDM